MAEMTGRWVARGEELGFAVVEINQASGWPERLLSDDVDQDLGWAQHTASEARKENAARGRREQYVVCALVPVEDGDE